MHPGNDVRRLAAVMFTDIAGYTAMVQENEAAALRKVSLHRRHLEEFTTKFHGRIIQFYGDGSLSVYDSAVEAVRCAIAMQRAYGDEVPVRIGIHIGDIMIREGTVFGDGVNIASRIQAEGIPGSVLISAKVNSEVGNHEDISTYSLGRYRLKNVQDPVEVYAVISPGVKLPARPRRMQHGLRRHTRYGLPVIAIILALVAIYLFNVRSLQTVPFQEARIAIPEFDDFTNDPAYQAVGRMAAHWITTELIESVHATVVSYQSAVEARHIAFASTGRQQFADHTGAVNVIQGVYMLAGAHQDSLEFSATIMNLKTGEILPVALPRVRCPATEPLKGIEELASRIKGYWESKHTGVLKPPRYDAYTAYLEARALWFDDDVRAVGRLRASIDLDPDFIDAYFLMLDWYYNQRRYADATEMIAEMKARFPNLTERQKNLLNYHEADNQGRNVEAFSYFLNEFQRDPKDLFVNTSGMVLASEYVNSPETVIEFFSKINADSLDLTQCSYCSERLSVAISAYLPLGRNREARRLVHRLRDHLHNHQQYMTLLNFYLSSGDTASVNKLLSEAQTELSPSWSTYLHLFTARQSQLKGRPHLRDHYARITATLAADSSRMLARCYYLMGDLNHALKTYGQALLRDSADSRIYAEMGIIYALQKNTGSAELMITTLDTLKGPFDYGQTPYQQARIAAYLGDRHRALDLLRQALDDGIKFIAGVTFNEDPDLMMLHHDTEYRKMLRRI